MADVDLFWQAKWKTLGQGVHWEYHRAIGNVGIFNPPDAHSASLITTGANNSSTYPAPSWVDAIDKSNGRADWQLGEFARLSTALQWLRVFDPVAESVVVALCIQGRSTITFGRGVRHWSLAEISQMPPFVDDLRKAQEWLLKSWEVLGVLLASQAVLQKADEANCVARWALDWVRERGLLDVGSRPDLR